MDIYSLPAAKFMSKKVITAKINSTVQSVCKSMYDNNVGSVVIVKKDKWRNCSCRYNNRNGRSQNNRLN